MAKVNRVADLPEWFDLKKYAGTEKFKAAEWVEQLEIRQNIFECMPVSAEEEIEDEVFGIKWHFFVSGEIKHTRETPVFLCNNPSKWALFPESRPVKPFNLLEQREQLVNDWRAVQGGEASQWLVERWEAFDKDCKWRFHRLETDEEIQRVKQLRAPFFLTDRGDNSTEIPVISVDLRAADAVLRASFEIWLKEARALSPEISKRNRPAYNDWSRYGLLPYLDLLIWSKETGRHIPHRVLSEAVSIYNKGESSFGKTVVPLAARLMDDLSELRALAVHEELAQTEQIPE